MMGKRQAVLLALSLFLPLLSAFKNTNGTNGSWVLWECHHPFSDPSEAKESRIYWQGIEPSKVLHFCKEGEENLDHQDESFKNRTKIFPNQIPSGNLSLAIKLDLEHDNNSVEVVISSKDTKKICQTTLNVAVSFQKPTVEMNQTDMTVTCSTKGGYPVPEVKWTSWDRESGLERTLEEDEIWNNITKEKKLYNIVSKANATGSKKMTCTVYNPTSNEILIGSIDIPAQGTDNHNGLGVGGIVGIVLGVVLVGVLAFVLYKCCRQRCQQGPAHQYIAAFRRQATTE
ncbi:ICOS ligand-like [Sphaeramia orbicularis]|uniref:ICOS ligand-like n=1 Tax=Sphaeramia orbicularis TaxID=375764 RepID=UPI00117F36C3|nr:ICOS ligand-like [Sphaeramia orbicularis]XP_029979947.1 ICOS ligand-like [Sphaeramia orbicularis]